MSIVEHTVLEMTTKKAEEEVEKMGLDPKTFSLPEERMKQIHAGEMEHLTLELLWDIRGALWNMLPNE